MAHRPLRPTRWSARRAALGVALVLHLLWLALATAPVASARESGSTALPCHEAMMHLAVDHEAMDHTAMTLGGPPVTDQHSSPLPTRPAPTHMPCCTQNCACAAGLCAVTAATLNGTLLPAMYIAAVTPVPLLPSREPTPELRPPILH